jgi:glycosyltransferase involved in cell wall biosynthesis
MTISVIIPTFNRPLALKRALNALARSSYPRDEFEVIVVDDGGSVPLEQVIAEARRHMNVIFTRQTNSGPGVARNTGARLASGRYLALTDDDCEPAGNWLSAFESAFETSGDVMAGGIVVNVLTDNVYAEASQRIIDLLNRHFNRDPANARFFTSNNFAIPARLHRQIGGFDQAIRICGGEDREYCDRWISQGFKMVWAKDALVSHRHEMGLFGFMGQHFRYGCGAFALLRARQRRGLGPFRFEGWKFHASLWAIPLKSGGAARVLRLWALIVMAQFLTVGGFAWAWARGATFGTWMATTRQQG